MQETTGNGKEGSTRTGEFERDGGITILDTVEGMWSENT